VATNAKTVNVKIRLEPELYEAMARLARKNDRTTAAEMRRAMRAWVEVHGTVGMIQAGASIADIEAKLAAAAAKVNAAA
jgi:predicted transcriptional regulator